LFKNLIRTLITITIAGILAFSSACPVSAATVAELEAQIAQLQQQLAILTADKDESAAITAELIKDLQRQLEEERAKPQEPPKIPKIRLQEPSVITIKNTSSYNGELTLKNIGTQTAQNLFVQADRQDAPLVIYFTDNANYIKSLGAGNTTHIPFRIEAEAGAAPGIYAIKLNFTFIEGGKEVTDSDIIQVRLDKQDGAANIILHPFKNSLSEIKAGAPFSLETLIENIGGISGENVQLTIDGLTADGVYLDGSVSSHFYKEIKQNEKLSASFSLKAAKNAKAGTYPLTFKLSWQNEKGEPKENTFIYYAVVSAADGSGGTSKIKTGQIDYPSGDMAVGADFTVTIPVTNTGDGAANVTINAKTDAEGAIVPRSANTVAINELAAGETREVSFTFMATSKSESRNYAIGFEFSSSAADYVADEEPSVFSQYVGINVNNPDADKKEEEEEKKNVPKIIISRYESDPIVVAAGTNFDLTIAFLNTNSNKTIKNVKAFLTSEEGTGTEKKGNVFTPVNASNTFYIEEIAPKAEVERKLTFYTVPDAEPRNYIIKVNFEYEDADGTQYEATEQFGINVKQITKIDTSEINIPTEGFVGQPISVYFDFYNTGRVTLSNLLIKIEGEFDTSMSSSYYSNFQPGAYDMYDMIFIPNEPGMKTGSVVISFEDDAGEPLTVKKEFTINVMDMGGMDMGMGGREGDMMIIPEEAAQGGNFFTSPVFIISAVAVAVIIIIVVIILVRRASRKRREMELDE